jgi:membrane protein implicated in regulation of membrane protease activity
VDFFQWIREHDWESWLALGLALGIAEMISLDLVLVMLATGALVGMITALIGAGIAVQVVAAVAAAVAALALVRPSVVSRLHNGPDLQLGHGKLVGKQGVVTHEVSAMEPGRIRIGGEVWTAEPYDDLLTIPPGSNVEVLDIRGATAYVHPLPVLDPPGPSPLI